MRISSGDAIIALLERGQSVFNSFPTLINLPTCGNHAVHVKTHWVHVLVQSVGNEYTVSSVSIRVRKSLQAFRWASKAVRVVVVHL